MVIFSQGVGLFQPENQLKIKEDKPLYKMHLKPLGSSAVDELAQANWSYSMLIFILKSSLKIIIWI